MQTFEPDFSAVFASTPIWKKGTYELSIEKVRGNAYNKTDQNGNKSMVRAVILRPKLVGVYDSNGKLSTELDGADIKGQPADDIRLYIHSQGALEFSKRIIMAILGFKREEEEAFNEHFKKLDLSFKLEENTENPDNFDVELGAGWYTLEGKHVIAIMSEGTRDDRDGNKIPTQKQDSFLPVGSIGSKKK